MADGKVAGRAAESRRVGAEWSGWSGQVAHPDAPAGGGGPGFFAEAGGGLESSGAPSDRGSDLPSPWQPGPYNELDNEEKPPEKPKPANAPPAVNARALGTQKSVQRDFVDVEITAAVLDDTTGGPSNGAHTEFTMPKVKAPGYDTDKGKITAFNGKLTWKGSIDIQTLYGSGASPSVLSCYGRGTTADDVKNRDITLGFHESCHHADYIAYLGSHPLPDPPEIKKDMLATDYEDKVAKFIKAVGDYKKAMDAASEKNTDEVGHRLSQVDSKGCYNHLVP